MTKRWNNRNFAASAVDFATTVMTATTTTSTITIGFAVEEVSSEITLRQSAVCCFLFLVFTFMFVVIKLRNAIQPHSAKRTKGNAKTKVTRMKFTIQLILSQMSAQLYYPTINGGVVHDDETNGYGSEWIGMGVGVGDAGRQRIETIPSHKLHFIRFYANGISFGLHRWGFDWMQKLMTMIV